MPVENLLSKLDKAKRAGPNRRQTGQSLLTLSLIYLVASAAAIIAFWWLR